MNLAGRKLFLCSCNATMPLDGDALARALALEGSPGVHSMLCKRELAQFEAASEGDVLVACTQEQRLLSEVAQDGGRTQAIRFVNIRETGGWSAEAPDATPKIAALLALAALPDPDPVPSVSYESGGRLLIIGPLSQALQWAEALKDRLEVAVLAAGRTMGSAQAAELPPERTYPVYSGQLQSLTGWLGAFTVEWSQTNPIDLDLCTRCNACIHACPESAIDWSYQIDLDRCRDHRLCVAACGAVGAIDFGRRDTRRSERFDLVLDLGATPALTMHQPPQGYFAPGAETFAQARAAVEIAALTGEFEKPKFFNYKASICAHSRSGQAGCSQCIDVCSAAAIRADGDRILVEPHLCVGCGACTTVCPSGALTYAYPAVPDLGARFKTVLSTYANAGGRDACLLLHAEDSRNAIARLARRGKGLPARVIPVEVHHIASVGIEVWLSALAWGAAQVAVLSTGNEAPHYRAALAFQMQLGDTIANALGYQGEHFRIVDGADTARFARALWEWQPALTARVAATFVPAPEKRTTLGLALDHLARHAPVPKAIIPLPEGAPFGAIAINADTCTMCLACVGSCPEAAILDNLEAPQVRFIETKCVQCGICAATCPEHAITLNAQLDLTPAAKAPRVLNEAAIFGCIRCGKPLGTDKMIATMLTKLASHSMFAAPGALDRLKMCADCRVVDLIKHENSADIRDF